MHIDYKWWKERKRGKESESKHEKDKERDRDGYMCRSISIYTNIKREKEGKS